MVCGGFRRLGSFEDLSFIGRGTYIDDMAVIFYFIFQVKDRCAHLKNAYIGLLGKQQYKTVITHPKVPPAKSLYTSWRIVLSPTFIPSQGLTTLAPHLICSISRQRGRTASQNKLKRCNSSAIVSGFKSNALALLRM